MPFENATSIGDNWEVLPMTLSFLDMEDLRDMYYNARLKGVKAIENLGPGASHIFMSESAAISVDLSLENYLIMLK